MTDGRIRPGRPALSRTNEETTMSSHWSNPLTALAPRVSEANEAARHALHEAREIAGRHLDSGLHLARELSAQAHANSLRAGRSARDLVQQRPVESVLLVAGAAFAIGWLVSRLRATRTATPAARTAPARARSRKRAA